MTCPTTRSPFANLLSAGHFQARPHVTRTYTRRARIAANLLLLVFLALLYCNARGGGLAVAVLALAVSGPAVVYYGYFIASQLCVRCGQSIVVPWSSYQPEMALFAVATPLRVPLQCPHCNTKTPWRLKSGKDGGNVA